MQRKLHRSVIEIRRSSATRPWETRSTAPPGAPIWPIIVGMAYEFITVDVEAPTATVTLNRPKVLNALSPELVAEVNQPLRHLDSAHTPPPAHPTLPPHVFPPAPST